MKEILILTWIVFIISIYGSIIRSKYRFLFVYILIVCLTIFIMLCIYKQAYLAVLIYCYWLYDKIKEFTNKKEIAA